MVSGPGGGVPAKIASFLTVFSKKIGEEKKKKKKGRRREEEEEEEEEEEGKDRPPVTTSTLRVEITVSKNWGSFSGDKR